MPTYHFHSVDGSREPDPDGIELADDAAARQTAARHSADVLKSDPTMVWRDGSWRVEVTDADNALLFSVITLAIEAPRPIRPPADDDAITLPPR